MRFIPRLPIAICALVGVVGGLGSAHGQQSSSRPITIVVPFTAGGGIDAAGRMVAANLESTTGPKIVVENRPGAGGYAGSEYVARATPDGHTLLMSALSALHSSLFVKDLATDLTQALVPVALVAESRQFLMGSTTIPARTLTEFVSFAKRNPKKLNAAVLAFSADHLRTLRFLQQAGIDVVSIPYNSGTDAVRALVSGDVHLYWVSLNALKPQIDAGRVVALAVGGTQRSELLPNVQTIREQGVNFEGPAQNFVVLGPAGMNSELVAQLNRKISAALNNPATRAGLLKWGYELASATPEQLATRLARESKEMKEAAAEFDLKPQ